MITSFHHHHPQHQPAPVTPAPTTVASVVTTDDGVKPITDDDPNHDANEIYMKRLLHCMAIGRVDTCDADAICTWWCTHGSASPALGMCFSKQAAKEMNGAYYTCKVEDKNDNNTDDDNVGIATATTNRHDKGANHVRRGRGRGRGIMEVQDWSDLGTKHKYRTRLAMMYWVVNHEGCGGEGH